jgi:hypothetical protein
MGEGGNILEGDLLKSRISDRIPDHRYVIYTSRGTRVADVQPRPWRSIDPPRICPPFQVVVRHEGAVVTETIAKLDNMPLLSWRWRLDYNYHTLSFFETLLS